MGDQYSRLYHMGIDYVWCSRKKPVITPSAVSQTSVVSQSNDSILWDELSREVSSCQKCGLCRERRQAVFGVGDTRASWLFVGEAPGEMEDKQGEPFVGQAGQLLDAILLSIGLRRSQDVYIANAIKCRPPSNRTPTPDELATCFPYLEKQIKLIQPRIIVSLGRPATESLLGSITPRLGDMRGHVHYYQNIPVIVTYHPAYILRNSSEKKKVWEDLIFAQEIHQKFLEKSKNM